jgi:hypothetical protein
MLYSIVKYVQLTLFIYNFVHRTVQHSIDLGLYMNDKLS